MSTSPYHKGSQKLVGHGALLSSFSENTILPEWKFARLIVAPSHQGLGISHVILNLAIAHLDALNQDFKAEALASQNRSQYLFESKGFKPINVSPGKFNDYFDNGSRESSLLYSSISLPRKVICPLDSSNEAFDCLQRFCKVILSTETLFVQRTDTVSDSTDGVGLSRIPHPHEKNRSSFSMELAGMGSYHTILQGHSLAKELLKTPSHCSFHEVSLDSTSPFFTEAWRLLREDGFIPTGLNHLPGGNLALVFAAPLPSTIDALNLMNPSTEQGKTLLSLVRSYAPETRDRDTSLTTFSLRTSVW
jgi:Acetyltransferase (GNAT) domain